MVEGRSSGTVGVGIEVFSGRLEEKIGHGAPLEPVGEIRFRGVSLPVVKQRVELWFLDWNLGVHRKDPRRYRDTGMGSSRPRVPIRVCPLLIT